MRRLAALTLACGCASAAGPPPPRPAEPACLGSLRAELARAKELREAGKLDRTLRVLERAAAACKPGAPLTLAGRLDALGALGRGEQAAALAATVSANAPADAQAAAKRTLEAPSPGPIDARARVAQGMAALAAGRDREGREQLDRALVQLEAEHGAAQAVVAVATAEAPPEAPLVPVTLFPSNERAVLHLGAPLTRIHPQGAGQGATPTLRAGSAWVTLGRPALLLRDGASKADVLPGSWSAATEVEGALVVVGPGGARAIELSTGRVLGEVSWKDSRAARLDVAHVLVPEGAGAWSILRGRDLSVVARVESISPPMVRGGRVASTLRWNSRASVGLVKDLATGKQLFRRVLSEIPPDPACAIALAPSIATFAVASHGSVLRVDGATGKALYVERWTLGADPPASAGWLALTQDARTVCSGSDVFGWSRGGDAARPCFRSRAGVARVVEPPRDGALWPTFAIGDAPERHGAVVSADERFAAFFYRDPNIPIADPSPSALVVLELATGKLVRRQDLGLVRFEGWLGFAAPDLVYLRTRGDEVRWLRPSSGEAWRSPEVVPLSLELTARREGVLAPGWGGACFDPLRLSLRPAACREQRVAPPQSVGVGIAPHGWSGARFGPGGTPDFFVGPSGLAVVAGGRRLATVVPTSRSGAAVLLANGGVDRLGEPRLLCRFGDVLAPFEVCAERLGAPGSYLQALARPERASEPLTP